MVGFRNRGNEIRQFVFKTLHSQSVNILDVIAKEFNITKQSATKYINQLKAQGHLTVTGTTRNRKYLLNVEKIKKFELPVKGLQEDKVWTDHIKNLLQKLPENVIDIWSYGITEMINNVIDHSGSKNVFIEVCKTPISYFVAINDDGEGIFKKIKRELQLDDERHSLLELSKGKLTTDPARHTGEGIFFASRMFEYFGISSGGLVFSHFDTKKHDLLYEGPKEVKGTAVLMAMFNNSKTTIEGIFDKFSSNAEDGIPVFDKTIVPVNLARYGDEMLVSRSQAKRLLAGVCKFKIVIFDFKEIRSIGQAFADEIFRVFVQNNPAMEILFENANKKVERMIFRAIAQRIVCYEKNCRSKKPIYKCTNCDTIFCYDHAKTDKSSGIKDIARIICPICDSFEKIKQTYL